ncbi:citryl-CoA lyase [Falsirhodobacter halotolerans]|uniref:citryl-CoA lyase n=1 Tax=Falsirhodobacter halotolerans TaxID=1146892 RepID=UPI001FD3007C|nr:citryl-CoA lyase [Falsirhodobacter halotolerans]MCJ8138290.1 citryl-CoA lyase [Falsirhodobacter halotolerans]MCJ8139118.1 citryl-CoA lyase [Falsirhodobacter halotolerans]
MTDPSVEDWWTTSIIRMEPGVIEFRDRPIEDLIGTVSFPQMIWLMLRGDLPTPGQARLLEAALVASVDHGPQAPSIAIARMAVTCGVGLNNAMASAVNVLGDVHGGAGEQLVELFGRIDRAGGPAAVPEALKAHRAEHGKFVPGFGHRFHKDGDPRAPRLLGLVDDLAAQGEISGRFAAIARAIEAELARGKPRGVPMNIDGATAVIFAELGFAAPLARGIFCLSRSVGILAHAWEQSQQGGRNKGPMPPNYLWTYGGAPGA